MIKLLKNLFANLRGCLSALLIVVCTLFWCFFMYLLYPFKLISKNPKWLKIINPILVGTAENWIYTNNLVMNLTLNIKWDLPDLSRLARNQWYFIICNHQSWTDILVLQRIFLRKIPFIRFFIKKQLMWLPVLNLAWWAYDFPIMHRHSKEELEKNPELRLKDLQATQEACLRYQFMPVTVLNFLEGTRFTPTKHAKQHSTFRHLLVPKAGGFAFAVNAMDKKITHILDVTIIYPEGKMTFWDFLCGRVHQITVKLQEREVPPELLVGNYTQDNAYREKFKAWINQIWIDKDHLLDTQKH